MRLCVALVTLCGCEALTAMTGFGQVPEEDPIDLRPHIKEDFLVYVSCRAGRAAGGRAWEVEGLPVVHFTNATMVEQYFDANPSHGCLYAQIAPSNEDVGRDALWVHSTVVAFRGRVEREVVFESTDNPKVCKSLVGLKRESIIERERCNFGQIGYQWCKCCGKSRSPKNLICVPPTHKLIMSPSALTNATNVCIARMSYKAKHLEGVPTTTFTPHKPYPARGGPVSAAGLAYINSRRVLEGTAETFKTWVPFFLKPRNITLFIITESTRIEHSDVIKLFRLVQTPNSTSFTATVRGVVSPPIYLSSIVEAFPKQLNSTILAGVRPRCGCTPLCTGVTERSPDGFMINGLRYVQGTSVFVQELLQDQRLKEYDFLIKIDWDIRFFKTLEEDILSRIVMENSWGFHTGFANNGNGCSKDSQRAVDTYAMEKGLRASSAGDWLYENEALSWHSALFGVWTGLLYSSEYTELVDYLRNNTKYGYSWFRYRWTDQSVWPKLLGYFHPDLATALTDLRKYRWNPHSPRPLSVFYHRKKTRSPFELCCAATCHDGVSKPCYKPPFAKRGASRASSYIWCHRPPGNVTARIELELCER